MPAKVVFISHTSPDKPLVFEIQQRLALEGVDGWVDVREMPGGSILDREIQKAIRNADHVLVVISEHTINSPWVTKEVEFALKRQQARPEFKVIALLCPGVKMEVWRHWFKREPIMLSMESEVGGLDRIMPALLAAIGERASTGVARVEPKPAAPVAELVLELTDPTILQEEGKRRATAVARLIYHPADPSAAKPRSQRFRFTAPLGAIETGELQWYLEQYYHWPTSVYLQRAQEVERLLPQWGKALFAEMHNAAGQAVFAAWDGADKGTARSFTVYMERELLKGTPDAAQQEADEAMTLLLALPWELLHDDHNYLFQGEQSVRIRRQLPKGEGQEPFTTNPPVRILLLSPRPEKEGVGYIDHRLSARPLVEALSPLGDLAQLTVLTPPTFPALVEELKRAQAAGTPYHVVHFDGHGVYNPTHGLGQLVFEAPKDANTPGQREPELIDAAEIAKALHGVRVPLFILDACQSAVTEKDPTASVAGQLLAGGVASVIAMSHSVLVETAKRFVTAFYNSVLRGERIGQAMLAGQRALQRDTFRAKTFAGDFHLQDWFVPVLYQEEFDPQLVAEVPAAEVQRQKAKEAVSRLGTLPAVPEQTFVGRSRELLYAERMLRLPTIPDPVTNAPSPHISILGEGGEGKTTLAAELARWLVASGRFQRAAFISFEHDATADKALALLGHQLIPNFESKAGQSRDRGRHLVERDLTEQSTVIVLDNLESVLPPSPGSPGVATFEPEILDKILSLCKQLRAVGNTRLIFTSRETLPEPFDRNAIRLGRLSDADALELGARTLGENVRLPGASDEKANETQIRSLIDTVGGHARALVLVTREVARAGAVNASSNLTRIMQDLHARYPNDRERSLLASVKLSLDRLSPEIRKLIRPLGVFQGGGSLTAIKPALQIEADELLYEMARQLEGVGLVEAQEYGYLRFDPALAPTLLSELNPQEQAEACERWANTMQMLAEFLYYQQFANAQVALGLAAWELPNLLAALQYHATIAQAEETMTFSIAIESLAQNLGRRNTEVQAEGIRRTVTRSIAGWSQAVFQSVSANIERLLNTGNFQEAVVVAEQLVKRCEATGKDVYPGAAYDLAVAYFLFGRALSRSGASGIALAFHEDAERCFAELVQEGSQFASRMVSTARKDRADCLLDLGRLEEAATLYEQSIQDAQQRNDLRSLAVSKGQLGTVRMHQMRYPEALQAHMEARDTFEKLGEPKSVAVAWHQVGRVYREVKDYPEAEKTYQNSLRIERQLGNQSGQAGTLMELGSLYNDMERGEDAVRFYREAATIYVALEDKAREGRTRSNAANSLIALRRYDEARSELERAIVCKEPFGHTAELWKTFALLHDLERAVGNASAAQKARHGAMTTYLAYRRDGGESRDWGGQIVAPVAQAIAGGEGASAATALVQLQNDPEMPQFRQPLLQALLKIVAGERDPVLADDPDLYYRDEVELRLLLETLNRMSA